MTKIAVILGLAIFLAYGNASPSEIKADSPIAIEYVEPMSAGDIIDSISDPVIRKIIKDLSHCESGGNPLAVNPMDTDGTPSNGLLQFKDTTLLYFGQKYKTIPEDIELNEIQNIIFDPTIQIATAEAMLKNNTSEAFLRQQWPACSALHNYWHVLR